MKRNPESDRLALEPQDYYRQMMTGGQKPSAETMLEWYDKLIVSADIAKQHRGDHGDLPAGEYHQ